MKFCKVTSVHSCVCWSFALKGQCHKIFCFRFFYLSSSSNPLKIRKFKGLTKFVTFADLLRVWQFADLRFADPIFFAICGFAICWPKFVADLKLPQICKFFIFLLINTYLKCSNSNFYKIKISAQPPLQICHRCHRYFWQIANWYHCNCHRLQLQLIHEKNLKSKISWHCLFKLPFACTKLYKVKTAESRCNSLPPENYFSWLNLPKGPPPPTYTHTSDVSIF